MLIDRHIDHKEAFETLDNITANTIKNQNIIDDIERMEMYIGQQKRIDEYVRPDVTFYSEDFSDIELILGVLVNNNYEVLCYKEESGWVVRAINKIWGKFTAEEI